MKCSYQDEIALLERAERCRAYLESVFGPLDNFYVLQNGETFEQVRRKRYLARVREAAKEVVKQIQLERIREADRQAAQRAANPSNRRRSSGRRRGNQFF